MPPSSRCGTPIPPDCSTSRRCEPMETMTMSSLPVRDLDRDELTAIVDQLAEDSERWTALVDYDDAERVFVSLHRDDHVDIWLLCWTPVNDTGWHDHDISSGAVRVVRGALAESNPRIGGEPVTR